MPAPRTDEPAAHDVDAAIRAHRLLVVMAEFGGSVTSSIVERLEDAALAGNVPLLIVSELAIHGPLRPRDLLVGTRLTSGGLTKQLDHLEQLGLIRRTFGALEDDRRATIVELTPRGAETAAVIADTVVAHLDDVRSFVRALSALLDE